MTGRSHRALSATAILLSSGTAFELLALAIRAALPRLFPVHFAAVNLHSTPRAVAAAQSMDS